MRKPTLAFLGFGKAAAAESDKPEETDAERKAREEKEAKDKAKSKANTDDEDEEEDEDEDEKEGDADREARVARNALRAAGERRGRKAEKTRVAAILNGVTPDKVEMATHLALNTDMAIDVAKATIDKAPKGAAAGFIAAMNADTGQQPGFVPAGGPSGDQSASLSGRMAATLKKQGWK